MDDGVMSADESYLEIQQQLRRARAETTAMRARARRLGMLAAALAAAPRVEDVARVLGEHVQEALDCQTYSLRQVLPGDNVARAVELRGVPAEHQERFTDVRLDVPSAVAEVVLRRRPVFLRSAADNRARYGGDAGAHYESARIEALARLPLLVEGALIGILSLGYWTPQEFSPEDQLYLTTVADLAAQALHRARTSDLLRRESRRHRLLSAAQAAINRRLDPASELRALARVVVPELSDTATVHVLDRPVPPGALPPGPVRTHRVASEVIDGVDLPATFTDLTWFENEPITEAVRQRRMIQWPPLADAPVPAWAVRTGAAAAVRTGLNHLLLAPVLVDGQVAAVATFGMCHGRAPWEPEDMALIHEITEHAAVALARRLTYEQSRHTALVLQRSLLLEPPTVAGLQVCMRYEPAGRDEVGGDWYDAFELAPGRLVLAVGDVVGHDITAAAAMGQLRAVLRSQAMQESLSPAEVLDRVAEANSCLHITPFATALFARLNRVGAGWELSWSSAGHLPPLLLEPGRPARSLEQHGGVALAPGIAVPHRTTELRLDRPGSTVLFFTDGLVERRGVAIDDGIAELGQRAYAMADRPLAVMCDCLVRGAAHSDDVALLAIRLD
jgi:serine phosphatase RsbU (regulator of sigma subunit)